MPTSIEWTDETWNPVTGCSPLSAGCANCYAERMARRLAGRCGYPEAPHHFDVTLHPDRLYTPQRWKIPRRIFVCSMGDLFHEGVEILDGTYQRDIFALMALAQRHTFQILTKRPHVALNTMTDEFADSVKWAAVCLFAEKMNLMSREISWPLPNVWIGVTAENQAAADLRIPQLLQLPAAVRFVSCEPLLGPIGFEQFFALIDRDGEPCGPRCNKDGSSKLSWVIAGGETGPGARPAHPDWFRSVRDQCIEAGVPFFFKQHGAYIHESQASQELRPRGALRELMVRGTVVSLGGETFCWRVGKKLSGHLLDGQEWRQFPR